jgi:hypothetical protein
MFEMKADELGNFILVSCKRCFTDVRIECKARQKCLV